MTHISKKFSLDLICSGLIHMLDNKDDLLKFHPYLHSEFIYQHDSSDEVRNIRAFFRLLKEFVDSKRINELSSKNFSQIIELSFNNEEKLRSSLETWEKYYTNKEVITKADDKASFASFVNYLRVLEISRHSGEFGEKYASGDLDGAQKKLAEMLSRVSRITTESVIEILKPGEVVDIIEKPRDLNNGIGNFYMGCDPFDTATGGFAKQTLSVFIGATGSGKTALSHHIIATALNNERYVYLACVEDRKESFVYKLVGAMTGIKISDLKSPSTHGIEVKAKIQKAQKAIEKFLTVHFIYGQSIDSIHKIAIEHDEELIRKGESAKIPHIHVVDYTYHIAQFSFGDKTYEKIRNAYASRKNFALQYNKICIDFAQVNREGVKNLEEDAIITHKDLAGSFDMAQVCDNIISINRSIKDRDANIAKLHTAKSRDGITGVTVSVGTDFSSMRFRMNDWSIIDTGGHFFEKKNSDKSA